MSVKMHMETSYGFGPTHEMTGGEVQENHTYTFPDDPTLHPLVYIESNEGAELLQFKYGIVAFRDDDTSDWYVTRMD